MQQDPYFLINDSDDSLKIDHKAEEYKKNSSKVIKKKLTFKLQYELNNLPKQIDLLKEQIYHFEKILEAPDLYKKDYDLFITSGEKLGSLQLELETKEQRWLELMELT